jgi:hypothetical protein
MFDLRKAIKGLVLVHVGDSVGLRGVLLKGGRVVTHTHDIARRDRHAGTPCEVYLAGYDLLRRRKVLSGHTMGRLRTLRRDRRRQIVHHGAGRVLYSSPPSKGDFTVIEIYPGALPSGVELHPTSVDWNGELYIPLSGRVADGALRATVTTVRRRQGLVFPVICVQGAQIVRGWSGSAVFNEAGLLVGIVIAHLVPPQYGLLSPSSAWR